MSENERIDARLAALFAPSERGADAAFVARVERAVQAERHLARVRANAWRRFRGEAAASLAVVIAFALLWRRAPEAMTLEQLGAGPAAAGLILLFLWFAIELRPAATGKVPEGL